MLLNSLQGPGQPYNGGLFIPSGVNDIEKPWSNLTLLSTMIAQRRKVVCLRSHSKSEGRTCSALFP